MMNNIDEDINNRKRNHDVMVRNLFRKWLIEWIEENNLDWNVVEVNEDRNRVQYLDVNEEKYEVLLQCSRIFGDVRKLQNVNQSELSKNSIWSFFSSLLGYSKHDMEEKQEKNHIEDIKIAMFGSEISKFYHQMINSKERNKYLVGCNLSIIDYHSLRSLKRYTYQIFANAPEKHVGVAKSYFRGSQFVVLLFDSIDSLKYLLALKYVLNLYMELIFIQMKSSCAEPVEKQDAEQFIYSNFGEAVYLEIDSENNIKSVDSILAYATLLSDILMRRNLLNKNYKKQ